MHILSTMSARSAMSASLLLLTTTLAFAADRSAIQQRAAALENLIDSVNPGALERFAEDHLAPSFGAGRTAEQVHAQLDEIRQRCRGAGGVLLAPRGTLGFRLTFELDDHEQGLVAELEQDAPHRIRALVLEDKRAVAASPEVAPMTWDTLDQRLREEAERGFSGVVLAARDGAIVLHAAYGFADRKRRIPHTTSTIFAIGSTPIDFTHAAILKLVDDGKLSLTDPLTRFIADVPEDKRAITIEHLRTSRSGLKDFPGIPGVDDDLDLSWIDRDEFVARMLASDLRFEPGAGRAHSHAAWGLLAVIIEMVTQQTFEDYLHETFFVPLGMTRTGSFTFAHAFDPRELAVGYGASRIPPTNSPVHWGRTSWLVKGSGGMVSTPHDLFRWSQGIRGGDLLSSASKQRYGSGGIAAGGNDRGFLCLYNTDLDTLVIVCTNAHERPRDHAQAVAEAAVRVAATRR